MEIHTQGDWKSILQSFSQPHILQTQEWGEIKAHFGWQPTRVVWREGNMPYGAALLLERSTPLQGMAMRLRVLYVPKGPILRDWADAQKRAQVMADLAGWARRRGAIFLKIDPDVEIGRGIPETQEEQPNPLGSEVMRELATSGWVFSPEQIQFRNTMLLDLDPTTDQLLQNMKQKTRYNIRLARRKGVSIRAGGIGDLELLYAMYAETALRDGFTIRGKEYYLTVWRRFIQAGMAEPLIAEVEGRPVAGLIVFRFKDRAWYLYGMSTTLHREKMPNYLLQWAAIERTKSAGCRVYDLWGAPDTFTETDALWGVYRFKEGLGAQVVRTLGAWDMPIKPFAYQLYTRILPRILEVMRRRGQRQTATELAASL